MNLMASKLKEREEEKVGKEIGRRGRGKGRETGSGRGKRQEEEGAGVPPSPSRAPPSDRKTSHLLQAPPSPSSATLATNPLNVGGAFKIQTMA